MPCGTGSEAEGSLEGVVDDAGRFISVRKERPIPAIAAPKMTERNVRSVIGNPENGTRTTKIPKRMSMPGRDI